MVHASGEGLVGGKANEKCKFFVNTVNAGSGTMNVFIDGPSMARMNIEEEDEGYEVCQGFNFI